MAILKVLLARLALAKNAGRTPRDIFTDIYRKGTWRKSGDFDSGPGSDDWYALPYAEAVNRFIKDHDIGAVTDLGCGDFRVGRHIRADRYIGVDVVTALIERNRNFYGTDHASFRCLDITQDPLPNGELCLIREVFQHLSLKQIAAVLSATAKYKSLIVTDAQRADINSFKPNVDRPAGAQAGCRLGSGLRLDLPPFGIPNVSVLLETPLRDDTKMVMRSFLVSR